ncbi:MAG TPA: acyloxyacyl hydrolase [Phycisphaerales bacterium]|nr:acyloxyacyl hydrolase [Phycisphaerales bacterium]
MIDPIRRGFKWLVWAAVGAAGASAGAAGAPAGEPSSLPAGGARARFVQPEAEQGTFDEAAVAQRYGAEGTQWILFGGGAAYDLQDSTDLNVNAAYSVFLINDVEWLLELGAWYHAQEGDDAASLNPVMEFRWHFFNNGDTSVFLNGGIGVLFATDEVPDTGTGFDFTPRAGIGMTQRIGRGGSRLIAGLRWHHISNARINGEDRNPSRDAPMVYVQFAVPF